MQFTLIKGYLPSAPQLKQDLELLIKEGEKRITSVVIPCLVDYPLDLLLQLTECSPDIYKVCQRQECQPYWQKRLDKFSYTQSLSIKYSAFDKLLGAYFMKQYDKYKGVPGKQEQAQKYLELAKHHGIIQSPLTYHDYEQGATVTFHRN